MKSLHIVMISVLIVFTLSYLKPIQADDTNGIEIKNIQPLPSTIIIGQTFKISATLVNNSSQPIFVDYGSCEAPFSVTFDNHVLVNETHPICALSILQQKLNPGENTTATSPNLDLVYRAIDNGTTNATITFPYEIWNQTSQSKDNEIVSKPFSFTIYGRTRVPTLSLSGNQAIIDVALAIPGLQKWSNDWQFVSMGFMTAKNQPGNWQYAILNLKASSNSSLIPCDNNNDWWAWVMIDRTTMKVIQATYPTIESHNCNYATGGGPGTFGNTIPKIDTPLHQFKSGIAANDVKCEQDLQLVIKAEDGSPTCVRPQTAQKLVERGWGWVMQSINSIKPLLPNRIIGLENDTGIVTLGNQTYYFETPHYTQDAYVNPVQISFHDVLFTLFPSGFRGGLPTNDCGSQYYWTDAKFSDGISESLHIFPIISTSQQCLALPEPTYFSNHTNPQAGLTFYDGKMKLLVRDYNQLSVLQLSLSTNSTVIQSGQAIGITISVNNPTSNPIQLPAQNNWSYGGVDTGPCSRIGYGIAILDGYYETGNLTQSKNLPIFNPGVLCPFIQENAQMYEFQPASDHVKEIQCNQTQNMRCNPNSYGMGSDYGFAGYWHYGNIMPFKSGIYTVVGADEWGHVTIQHFTVINSTKR